MVGHGFVAAAEIFDLDRRAGHFGRALGHADKAAVGVFNRFARQRPHIIPDRSPIGHDVGGRSPVGDDIVDAGVRGDVLAQIIGAHIHQLDGVERAAAVVRVAARMGCAAVKMENGAVQPGAAADTDRIDRRAVP